MRQKNGHNYYDMTSLIIAVQPSQGVGVELINIITNTRAYKSYYEYRMMCESVDPKLPVIKKRLMFDMPMT